MKLAATIESNESRRPAVKASNKEITITLMRSGREIGLVTFWPDRILVDVYEPEGASFSSPGYSEIHRLPCGRDSRYIISLPKTITVKEKECPRCGANVSQEATQNYCANPQCDWFEDKNTP